MNTENVHLPKIFNYLRKPRTFHFTEFLAHLTDHLCQKMKKFDVKGLSAFFWYLLLYSAHILHVCIYYLTTNKRILGNYMYIYMITNNVKYSGKCHEMKAFTEVMGKGHFDQAFLFFAFKISNKFPMMQLVIILPIFLAHSGGDAYQNCGRH